MQGLPPRQQPVWFRSRLRQFCSISNIESFIYIPNLNLDHHRRLRSSNLQLALRRSEVTSRRTRRTRFEIHCNSRKRTKSLFEMLLHISATFLSILDDIVYSGERFGGLHHRETGPANGRWRPGPVIWDVAKSFNIFPWIGRILFPKHTNLSGLSRNHRSPSYLRCTFGSSGKEYD